MTSRLWVILVALGIIGYIALVPLFKRYDPATRWNYSDTRDSNIAVAREFAAKAGYDVTAWKTAVKIDRSRNVERFILEVGDRNRLEQQLLSPIKSRVYFFQPAGIGRLEVGISNGGQVVHFSRAGISSEKTTAGPVPDRAAGEKRLGEILGGQSGGFTFKSESEGENGSRRLTWTLISPQNPELVYTAQLEINATRLVRWDVDYRLPAAYQDEIGKRGIVSFALVSSLKFVLNVVFILCALTLFFLGASRRENDYRTTVVFLAANLVLLFISNLINGTLDDFRGGTFTGISNPNILAVLPNALFLLVIVGLALLASLFWISGEAISARYRTGRAEVAASVLRGRIYNRVVAQNLVGGILLAGFVSCIPYLVSFVFRLPTTPVDLSSREDLFGSQFPVVATLTETVSFVNSQYFLLIVFGFLVPLIGSYLQKRWIGRLLFLVTGFVLLSDLNANQSTSMTMKVLVTLLVLGSYLLCYLKLDLLAVIVANIFGEILIKALTFLEQPSPALQKAGLVCLAVLGLTALVGFVFLTVAPEGVLEHRDISSFVDDQAERERLRAEFGIARRAQEKLLPVSAPHLPGFEIAAICRPARECGGDLYEFISLPDGKLAVVVADVSGKGVPAALYMTLTKGLLLSIVEQQSDPGEMLRAVNKHLYEVCKRKVFVTLFLGIIDPVSRTFTFSRAGHNPPVWRRTEAGKTEFLRPPGIGLGLDSGKAFDRILKVQNLQLEKNDLLVLYSDGISEAMNGRQEEYGEDRLVRAAEVADGMGAEEALGALLADVGNFLEETPAQDDQTVVMIRVAA